MAEIGNKMRINVSNAHTPAYTRVRESEKDLESHLVAGVKARGGLTVKLTSQFHKGLPDRLVLLPFHTACFVELKSTGKKRTKLQELAGEQLEALGFRVFVIDSSELLYDFFQRMDKRIRKIQKLIEDGDVQTA